MATGEKSKRVGQPLKDGEFLRLMIETLGVQGAGRVALFCLYWRATGLHSFAQIAEREEVPGFSRSWRYRAYRELRQLRERVAEAEGRELELAELGRRVMVAQLPGGSELAAAAV